MVSVNLAAPPIAETPEPKPLDRVDFGSFIVIKFSRAELTQLAAQLGHLCFNYELADARTAITRICDCASDLERTV
jgi:hypothetical protein